MSKRIPAIVFVCLAAGCGGLGTSSSTGGTTGSTSAECPPSTAVELFSAEEISQLSIVGERMYYVDEQAGAEGLFSFPASPTFTGALKSRLLDGTDERTHFTPGSKGDILSIAVDATNAFVLHIDETDTSKPRLDRIALASGTVALLASEIDGFGWDILLSTIAAQDPDNIYITPVTVPASFDTYVIEKINKQTGAHSPLVTHDGRAPGHTRGILTSVRIFDGKLWYFDGQNTGAMFRTPLNTPVTNATPVGTLTNALLNCQGFVLDASGIYCGTPTKVTRWDLDATSSTVLADLIDEELESYALPSLIEGNKIISIQPGSADRNLGAILSLPLTGGTHSRLLCDRHRVFSFTQSGTQYYWAEQRAASGPNAYRVFRMPK